jgi:hypothetical protein
MGKFLPMVLRYKPNRKNSAMKKNKEKYVPNPLQILTAPWKP